MRPHEKKAKASPLKIFHTNCSHIVMNHTHRVDKLLFGLLGADNIEVHQEMIGYSNQGILGPSAKPVHCTAGYQTRKLQGPVAELFSNL